MGKLTHPHRTHPPSYQSTLIAKCLSPARGQLLQGWENRRGGSREEAGVSVPVGAAGGWGEEGVPTAVPLPVLFLVLVYSSPQTHMSQGQPPHRQLRHYHSLSTYCVQGPVSSIHHRLPSPHQSRRSSASLVTFVDQKGPHTKLTSSSEEAPVVALETQRLKVPPGVGPK